MFNGRAEMNEFGKRINKNKKHMDKINMTSVAQLGVCKGYTLLTKRKSWEA